MTPAEIAAIRALLTQQKADGEAWEATVEGTPEWDRMRSRYQSWDIVLQAYVPALVDENERLRQDAERWRWLVKTFEAAKGGASLNLNDDLGGYQTPEPGKECRVQWYPDTPVGFYVSEAATMNEAVDAAMRDEEAP